MICKPVGIRTICELRVVVDEIRARATLRSSDETSEVVDVALEVSGGRTDAKSRTIVSFKKLVVMAMSRVEIPYSRTAIVVIRVRYPVVVAAECTEITGPVKAAVGRVVRR